MLSKVIYKDTDSTCSGRDTDSICSGRDTDSTCSGRDTGSTCLGTVRVQTIGTCTMHSRGYNQQVYFCAGGYTCSTCKDTVGIHKLFVQVWIIQAVPEQLGIPAVPVPAQVQENA